MTQKETPDNQSLLLLHALSMQHKSLSQFHTEEAQQQESLLLEYVCIRYTNYIYY